jgi:hypothetical protein
MPTVYIWRPHGEENPYGHVALATDKYYVSFWTAQVLFDDSDEEIPGESKAKRLKRKLTDLLNAVGVFKGHRGGLVLHQDLDKEYESDQDLVEYQIDAIVTDEDDNSIYEEFQFQIEKSLGMIWNREISPLPSIQFLVEHANDDV